MTEDEARAVVERMRRDSWLIAAGAMATNLMLVAFNVLWGSLWWVPLNLIGLAVTAWGVRRLIEQERACGEA